MSLILRAAVDGIGCLKSGLLVGPQTPRRRGAPRLGDNEECRELFCMLRRKVRHHGREIGARVRFRIAPCVGLATA
jgi:hypothetical protein